MTSETIKQRLKNRIRRPQQKDATSSDTIAPRNRMIMSSSQETNVSLDGLISMEEHEEDYLLLSNLPALSGEENQYIDALMREIDKGQEEIERLKKPQLLQRVTNFFKGREGRKEAEMQKYQEYDILFSRQVDNARRLTYILVSMVKSREGDKRMTEESIEKRLSSHYTGSQLAAEIRSRIGPAKTRYRNALQKICGIHPSHPEYRKFLSEITQSERVLRKLIGEHEMATMYTDLNAETFDREVASERIFDIALTEIKKEAIKSKVYLDSLRANQRTWKAVGNLYTAQRAVSGNLGELTRLHRELNNGYVERVRRIRDEVNNPQIRNQNTNDIHNMNSLYRELNRNRIIRRLP